jgi:glycosyltransferase involved in cell wall biosynthesis
MGGVEAAASNLVDGLAGCRDVDLGVVAVCAAPADPPPRRWRSAEITYVAVRPGWRGWRTDLHGRVFDRVRAAGYDLVHVHAYASLAARLPGSILTVHGIAERDVMLKNAGIDRYARAAVTYALEGVARRRARRVIAISDLARRAVAADGRIWRIPNAVHRSFFAPERDRGRGCPATFLYAGVLSPLKNVAGLIRAFSRISGAGGAVRLVVAGGGLDSPYGRHCQDLAASLGLTGAVSFLGNVGAREMAELHRAAGTLVLFSRQENAPMAICEALASGSAVVATDVGGVGEILRGLPGCHVVQPGDEAALTRQLVLCREGEAPGAAAARRAAAGRYHPDAVAAQTRQAYFEVLYGAGVPAEPR